MATAFPSDSDLDCSICFERFEIPKVLSCGHSFCLECLEIYVEGRKRTFPCPVCKQSVKIPRGGVNKIVTNFSLQTFTDSLRTADIPTTQPSTVPKPKHHCPNHRKKELEHYCQTCNLGLCSKCIYKDHKDHKTLDLECDSTRELLVEERSKSEQVIKNKIEDLEKTHTILLETSEKLISFCDEACFKINEKTEKIIGDLRKTCKKRKKKIRRHLDRNESKLSEARQQVMAQMKNIKTDLDTSCLTTTEEPYLTLIQSLTKLQDLQKLCENMKTDIPPVTYVEWREGSGKVCDILGSTDIKPLDQPSEDRGYIPTVTKPVDQPSEDRRYIPTVTKPLDPHSEGSVFTFNSKDIKADKVEYYSKDKCTMYGMIWSCSVVRERTCFFVNIEVLQKDNPELMRLNLQNAVTLANKNRNRDVVSGTKILLFTQPLIYENIVIEIPWKEFTDPSEGFIDNEGQFYIRFDILNIEYK